MSKLESKHVLPYVLYGAKMLTEKNLLDRKDRIWTLQPSNFPNNWKTEFKSKLILRPLSDITKVFETMEEDDKKVIMHCDYLLKEDFVFWQEPYFIIQILFKYHFDVFGLIEKGLAISIHDVV